ncbi:MAG TPA: META domain-containing protein, partial [Chitinophagaceae bacterium]|nr:META domain-containing protein [Chitinophagaceae bacterium]
MKIIFISLALGCSLVGFQALRGLQQFSPTVTIGSSELISGIPADTSRLDGTWFLQPVLASDTATGKIPTLVFNVNKSRFTGHTGCNNMSGRFEISGKILRFDSNLITTRMACPGYHERAFIKSLLHTNGYKFDNGVLILLFDATELSR